MSLVNDSGNIPLSAQMRLTRDVLVAYQRAMAVVSNNVTNLDTEGYHRQSPVLETREPMDSHPGQVGTGVRLQQIERIYERYAEDQVRYENGLSGRWEAQSEGLRQTEVVFSEIQSYSIAGAMQEFWNSWQDFANDADSIPSRVNVIQRAENLASAFHGTTRALGNLRESLNHDIRAIGTRINDLAENIAIYNKDIITATRRGQNPNTLMDKRDLLIKELSRLAGATVQEDDSNGMTVYLGRVAIVHRDHANRVVWIEDSDKGKGGGDLAWSDSARLVSFEGGETLGKLEVRDNVIPEALADLDLLAATLRDRVNELHSEGIGMDGTSGTAFWRQDTVGAIDLAVNNELKLNPVKLAASTESATGDNSLANRIFELQYEKIFTGGTADFGEFYQGTVSRIANEIQYAETREEASAAGLEQAENWQQSISGVNLDEELTRMIALQRVYTASARVLMKLDEMTTVVLMMAR